MLKRVMTAVVVALLINLTYAGPAFASSKAEQQARHEAKVKAGINKLGVGPDARVKLKLRDKTQLAGYVSRIGEETFVVTNEKTGEAALLSYSSVRQVQGNNLSTGAKVAIGVGIAVAVIIILYSVRGAFCDGQC